MNSRRNFISLGCKACLAIAFAQSCRSVTPSSAQKNNLKIPLPVFDELGHFVYENKNGNYDLLFLKKNDDSIVMLKMQCTHQYQRMNVVSEGLFCPSHGSLFSFQGNVLQGPAYDQLSVYPVTVSDGMMEVIFDV